MGAYREAFLDVFTTPTALLAREARGHSHDHMTGSYEAPRLLSNIKESR